MQKLKFLPIIDPIQIFSFKIPQNGAFIEKYIMQTWAPFSSDTSTTIAMNNVVFVGRLKEYFIEKYIEYITDPNSQQMVEEGDADDTIESEEDDTTIEEVIEDYINKEENRKKWYH
jgi:hypothetical protein